MRPVTIIAAFILALGAVEAVAYWWMHPAPAGLNQPVLTYRSGGGRQLAEGSHSTTANSSPATANGKRPTADSTSSSSILTPLPEVYDQAAPMLRCSSGQVFHAQLDETLGLHLAFFEWNDTDTGSVLEAFRHMPEACMGSIGMTLVSKEKPRSYTVRSSFSDQQSSNNKYQSAISSSLSSTANRQLPNAHTLIFDHTIFREAGQGGGVAVLSPQVHAFRAVWVAGMADSNARQGIGGDEFDHLRTIRLKSALTRFRPSHARVIQGAVRGAANGDAAWQAFQTAMLKDLTVQ